MDSSVELEEKHNKDNPHKLKSLPKCSQCNKFEIVPALGTKNLCQMCGSVELDAKYQLKPYLYAKMLGMKDRFMSGEQILEIEQNGLKKESVIGRRWAVLDVYLKDNSHYLLIYDAYLTKEGHKIIYKETLR